MMVPSEVRALASRTAQQEAAAEAQARDRQTSRQERDSAVRERERLRR